jgi:hypothetical protein
MQAKLIKMHQGISREIIALIINLGRREVEAKSKEGRLGAIIIFPVKGIISLRTKMPMSIISKPSITLLSHKSR